MKKFSDLKVGDSLFIYENDKIREEIIDNIKTIYPALHLNFKKTNYALCLFCNTNTDFVCSSRTKISTSMDKLLLETSGDQ